MKKTFAVVLAAMMMIAAFAGCGTKKTEEPATSPVVTEETTAAPEASTEAATEAPEASEAPVEAPSASPAA